MTTTSELQKSYAQLKFIHELLTQRTQFYVSEFEIASDCAKVITNMANSIAEQISEQQAGDAAKPVEASNEQA